MTIRPSLDFVLANLRIECEAYHTMLELEDFDGLLIVVDALKKKAVLAERLLKNWKQKAPR